MVTGVPDDDRQPLHPGSPWWATFAAARAAQDAWSDAAHLAFWAEHAGPDRWPRRAGRPAVAQTVELWALAMRRRGLAPGEIAAALYPDNPDSLRRLRVLDRAELAEDRMAVPVHGETWVGDEAEVIADAVVCRAETESGPLAWRLPRVFDHEPGAATLSWLHAYATVNLDLRTAAALRTPAVRRLELRASAALRAHSDGQASAAVSATTARSARVAGSPR